ncbi:MAG: hypothetical protein IJ370_04030 [Oscillospiraceae bacterium]|nr:hypothetical protein [Oscillospiraceae bacterium]MBQ8338546.1 hypothetical protein [Oscillospiraceae bacterium]
MAELNFPASDIESKQNKVEVINPDAASDEQYPNVPAVIKYVKENASNANTDKSYTNNNFANALKGAASGASVYVEDVSPLEHDVKLKLSSDSMSDFSDVTVIVSSAPISAFEPNLDMDGPGMGDSWDHIVYENGNEEYVLKAPYETEIACDCNVEFDTAHNDRFMYFARTDFANFSKVILEGNAEAYANYTNGSEDKQLYFPISNFSTGDIVYDEFTEIRGEFSIPENVGNYVYDSNNNTRFAHYKINQFRVKLVKDESAAFESAVFATPSADGTVEGVKSIAPSMAVATDTEGVTVELKYNKDVNKLSATGSIAPLMVEVKNGLATHSPAEMLEHIQKGGNVFFCGYSLSYITDGVAYFDIIYEDNTMEALVINSDKSTETYSYVIMTEEGVKSTLSGLSYEYDIDKSEISLLDPTVMYGKLNMSGNSITNVSVDESDPTCAVNKEYVDDTVAQKAQVQIITWEADD